MKVLGVSVSKTRVKNRFKTVYASLMDVYLVKSIF